MKIKFAVMRRFSLENSDRPCPGNKMGLQLEAFPGSRGML